MIRTILVLAANPKDTTRLRLDQEVREIENGLERAHRRRDFILETKLAARPVDVRRAMLDLKPNIVHFCGHGSGVAGIVFEDEAGNTRLVNAETLADFFELFGDTVECVVLNACYSEPQAEAIAKHIKYVVGMKRGIGDTFAITFAVAFYDALGAGKSFEFAYRLACNAIRWAGMPEHLTPILKRREAGYCTDNELAMAIKADNGMLASSDKVPLKVTSTARALVRIFLSAPDDVKEERRIVLETVRVLNDELAAKFGFLLEVISSDSSFPDLREIPTVTKRQIPDHDIFVGIMWARFGSLAAGAGSGTEDEFLYAMQKSPHSLLYFCNRPVPFPSNQEDIKQLELAWEFRERCQSKYTTYVSNLSLERALRRHLTEFLIERTRVGRHEPSFSWAMALRPSELERKFMETYWVGYTPTEFDPDIGWFPDEKSIEADLHVLATGPFGGIITFGSQNILARIPEIAKSVGMHNVIMGVYDPRELGEIEQAIAARDFVDGYCVGHMGLREGRYNQADVINAINKIRIETRKPVSTTESFDNLLTYEQLVESVDWLFPDVHHYWHEGSSPEVAFNELSEILGTLSLLGNQVRKDIIVVLKMISYPSAGAPGLTPENQADFFSRVSNRLRNAVNNPAHVYLSFFAAFDNSWKIPERRWSAGELSTGLYDIKRVPKQAVEAFRRTR